ncbi:hypothetical protein OB2597_06610 [Pseudooceanicola batsensis HTCC2597]|uniref:Uncharacterized protein n=1 Tax=Pseudooceanicola batsensis (strain ATCC BAA-863 / DSM 15984 / KCTC 12145 / HTCC2597) TaxID=252305 RepID=A3TTF7_PSEBH|nr:hypothetical protein [Pseudooceanicola batsensis]EAQ04934.1 hypothetical protein OB2597_06610 [Pseudooceanicola batsensis HTCC2597]
MAVVNVDLGSSDRTIDGSVAQNGDTLNITALGSQTLTIDGVSVAISNIASITSGAALTVTTVNGASLLFDQGLLNGNLLSSLAFEVNDTSSISFDSGSVSVLSSLLSDFSVSFNGTEDGSFEYEPAGLGLLSDVNVDVSGMESHDQLEKQPPIQLRLGHADRDHLFGGHPRPYPRCELQHQRDDPGPGRRHRR